MSEFGGNTAWGYTESVLIHGGKAIVTPGGEKCIAALNPGSGETVWTSRGLDVPAEYGSCIAIERDSLTLLVGVTSGGFVAVRADNGQSQWPANITGGGSQDTSTPVFADNRLFWSGGHGRARPASESETMVRPNVAWATSKDSSWQLGDFVIDNGQRLRPPRSPLDLPGPEDGRAEMERDRHRPGTITWADGMLYLFSERRGEAALVKCTPQGFQPCGRFRVAGRGKSWAHPVVSGGRLYLRYDTTLYCFNVRTD